MFLHLLLAPLLALSQAAALAPIGSICGNVQDENGGMASNVQVVAIYLGPHSGALPTSKTDASGNYCVEITDPGEYAMSAFDTERGYPLMNTMFYAEHLPGPRVTLSPENPNARIDWRIPYKAGFIRVHLIDARTGKKIDSMSVDMTVQSLPEYRYMRGGNGSKEPLLVPPNENVYLTVNSPGYREWPGEGTKGKLLNLLPGTTLDLAIALEPAGP